MLFSHKLSLSDLTTANLTSIEGASLTREDIDRLERYRINWNFYEGYHWEDTPSEPDSPQITTNYCRTIVNKYVAAELGNGFTFKLHEKMVDAVVGTIDGESLTLADFLKKVWEDNNQSKLCVELGQMKSITGDSWVQVRFEPPSIDNDPYGEYPMGRVRVNVVHSSAVFPTFDEFDKDKLIGMLVQYPVARKKAGILEKITQFVKDVMGDMSPRKGGQVNRISDRNVKRIMYKQIWTKDTVIEMEGNVVINQYANNYGVIPFIQIKNFPTVGKNEGTGDLEDVIPLNAELNRKRSDISNIIDYHASPTTVIFGAKVESLEKGANKLWGGLPKDAKVENIELKGDLSAAVNHIASIKQSMCEVGFLPENALGDVSKISNTSGVALEYMNLPLIERLNVKKLCTIEGIENINKLITLVSMTEGLIVQPAGVSNKDFYYNEVQIKDTLPKDKLIELQIIEQEMKMRFENRPGGMARMGFEDIDNKIKENDNDYNEHKDIYEGISGNKQLNSGMTNGSSPVETVRKEMTGQNGNQSGS